MSSASAILNTFIEETKKKGFRKNALNEYTIKRLLDRNQELTIFENERRKSISIQNPLNKLLKKGFLSRQQHSAGKKYCDDYELSNTSHHARVKYDSNRSSKSSFECNYTQDQADASKRIAKIRSLLSSCDLLVNKNRKVFSRNYLHILELIFEKQKCEDFVKKKLKMDHRTLQRKVREICEIILN